MLCIYVDGRTSSALARMYWFGCGSIKADPKKSLQYLLDQEASGGLYSNLHHIGYYYDYGESFGILQDYAKALDYYTRAAEQGNTASVLAIFRMKWEGLGKYVRDRKAAIAYLLDMDKTGLFDDRLLLQIVTTFIGRSDLEMIRFSNYFAEHPQIPNLPSVTALMHHCVDRLIERECPDGWYWKGSFYWYGTYGTKCDKSKAIEIWTQAHSLGLANANVYRELANRSAYVY